MASNIYGIFGTFVQNADFETLKEAYKMSKNLSDRERYLITKSNDLMTLLVMIEEEFAYRTPCDECRSEIDLDTSPRL
jgi:hypothetical protein